MDSNISNNNKDTDNDTNTKINKVTENNLDNTSRIGTSDSHPIFVNFIPKDVLPDIRGSLGITFAPGKWQNAVNSKINWQRNVEKDVDRIKTEYKINTIVTLIERHEFYQFKILNLRTVIKSRDINSIWFPIEDGWIPTLGEDLTFSTMAKFDTFLCYLLELLKKGDNLAIHCLGGMGRAGLVSSCILVKLGIDSMKAIKIVRETRDGAIENETQVKFILDYEDYLKSDF